MTYEKFDTSLPDATHAGAAIPAEARKNGNALNDALVFGVAATSTTYQTQNADGSTPASDASIPFRRVYASLENANDVWKEEMTYDAGNGNRPTRVEYFRSYNAGVNWLTIRVVNFTYDGSGNLLNW